MASKNDMDLENEEACSNFISQKWRKSKCQNCFKDALEHTDKFNSLIHDITKEQFNDQPIENDDCFGSVYKICVRNEDQKNIVINEEGQGRQLLTSSSTVVDVEQQQTSYSKQSKNDHSIMRDRYLLERSTKGLFYFYLFI